jgi:hypothetical protein
MNKHYNRISESITRLTSFGLWFIPFCAAIYTAVVIYAILTEEFTGQTIYIICGGVGIWIVCFICRWQAYNSYFVYCFEGEDLVLRLFNNKEVIRYRKDEVKALYFKDTLFTKEIAPHLIVEFTNEREIKFDREMEKFPALVDDMETWTGITLPNKKERLKNRDELPLNPYYR